MRIVTNSYPHNWSYQLNFEHGPFRDVRVRRAANYALNRADIVELLGGIAQEGPANVPPNTSYYGHPVSYKYDLAESQGAAEGGGLRAVQGDVRHQHLGLRPDAAAADERADQVAAWRKPDSR